MSSPAWPIKLIPIEHRTAAPTVGNNSKVDVAATKLQIVKHTHIFKAAAHKIYTMTGSRWALKINVTNSVSYQM